MKFPYYFRKNKIVVKNNKPYIEIEVSRFDKFLFVILHIIPKTLINSIKYIIK